MRKEGFLNNYFFKFNANKNESEPIIKKISANKYSNENCAYEMSNETSASI